MRGDGSRVFFLFLGEGMGEGKWDLFLFTFLHTALTRYPHNSGWSLLLSVDRTYRSELESGGIAILRATSLTLFRDVKKRVRVKRAFAMRNRGDDELHDRHLSLSQQQLNHLSGC